MSGAKSTIKKFPEYHDFAPMDNAWVEARRIELQLETAKRSAGGPKEKFPIKLHRMLEDVQASSDEVSIVSWLSHGRAFKVHDKARFTTEILPQHFRFKGGYPSFQRQLNIYGFRRMLGYSDAQNKNAYYHELFLQGRRAMSELIPRNSLGEHSTRCTWDPSSEPDFNQLPPLVVQQSDSSTRPTRSATVLNNNVGPMVPGDAASSAQVATNVGICCDSLLRGDSTQDWNHVRSKEADWCDPLPPFSTTAATSPNMHDSLVRLARPLIDTASLRSTQPGPTFHGRPNHAHLTDSMFSSNQPAINPPCFETSQAFEPHEPPFAMSWNRAAPLTTQQLLRQAQLGSDPSWMSLQSSFDHSSATALAVNQFYRPRGDQPPVSNDDTNFPNATTLHMQTATNAPLQQEQWQQQAIFANSRIVPPQQHAVSSMRHAMSLQPQHLSVGSLTMPSRIFPPETASTPSHTSYNDRQRMPPLSPVALMDGASMVPTTWSPPRRPDFSTRDGELSFHRYAATETEANTQGENVSSDTTHIPSHAIRALKRQRSEVSCSSDGAIK